MAKSLIVGLGLVAASIGYVVGSTHTQVMHVAVPTVFGLLVATFSVLQRRGLRSDLQALLEPDESAQEQMPPDTVTMLTALSDELKAAPRRIGVGLIVCSLCYMAAAIGGSVLSRPGQQVPRPLPWPQGDPPQNATTALEWISVQEGLLVLGYSAEQVRQLYALDRPESPGPGEEASEASQQPVGDSTPPDLSSLLESAFVGPPTERSGPRTVEPALPDGLTGNLEVLRDRLEFLLGDGVDLLKVGT